MQRLPSILSISFRPFFLLTALIAAINPVLWVTSYLGRLDIPLVHVDALFWHAHEMIFGFSGALIGGFILTASANWTGGIPYRGRALLLLALVWLIERVSYFLPIGIESHIILMNIFFPLLATMLFIKLKDHNKQKYVFMPILIGIMVAKLFHSYGNLYSSQEFLTAGKTMAIGFIRLILLLIAGRVIPFFTRSRIKDIDIQVPEWLIPATLAPLAMLVVPWPEATPRLLLVIIFLCAIITNIYRQYLWKPIRTISEPMLLVLHIGVSFITLSLVFEMLSLFFDQFSFAQASLHLLMAGGLGLVAIGMMTRVSLGHTGRVIKADNWMLLSFTCIIIGTLLRVFIPILLPDIYFDSLHSAVGFWTLGFLVYFVRFFKILITPRPDGKI